MIFSERYGYIKPSDIIIRERISPEIENALCTCLDTLQYELPIYDKLEEYIWCNFLYQRKNDIYDQSGYIKVVAINYIRNGAIEWYRKLDLIETIISFVYSEGYHTQVFKLIKQLNDYFERLNFGYRIVNGLIVEIATQQEIDTIEKALNENKSNVSMHLNNALKHYSQRPVGDYRNSIKEAISAVEAFNREITGEKTLNFKKMEDKGLKIPSVLRKAFENLYGYTNDEKTGIRHSLMDDSGEYVPGAEEALYMLITCSAFINYLNSKMK